MLNGTNTSDPESQFCCLKHFPQPYLSRYSRC